MKNFTLALLASIMIGACGDEPEGKPACPKNPTKVLVCTDGTDLTNSVALFLTPAAVFPESGGSQSITPLADGIYQGPAASGCRYEVKDAKLVDAICEFK